MAKEGGGNVVGGNALSVVGDADVGRTAVPDFHGDDGRARVNAVFHQLLDHRRGAFYHLSGCNQLGGMFI